MQELILGFKLKYRRHKKELLFLFGLAVIAFISGSIFIIFLSKSDQALVNSYVTNFMTTLKNGDLNYIEALKNSLLSNSIYMIIIWLLGISIIGLPCNIFIYFIKSFMIGFSLSSMFLVYHSKGIIYALIYVIPQLIYLIAFTFLILYAINFSIILMKAILKRAKLDFKILFNNYIVVFILSFILIVLASIIEIILIPFILQKILFFI